MPSEHHHVPATALPVQLPDTLPGNAAEDGPITCAAAHLWEVPGFWLWSGPGLPFVAIYAVKVEVLPLK